MGVQDSKIVNGDTETSGSKLFTKLDIIASKLILNTSFKKMEHLNNPEYCNSLTILTTQLLEKQLNLKQIQHLSQTIKNGAVQNEELIKNNVMYFDTSNIEQLGVKDTQQKHLLCVGISKYYIDIAKVYSSILSVIHPVYIFKNEDGTTQELGFEEYKRKYGYGKADSIKNVYLKKKNLCLTRLNTLILKEMEKTTDLSSSVVQEKSVPIQIEKYTPKYDITMEHFQKLQEKIQKQQNNGTQVHYETSNVSQSHQPIQQQPIQQPQQIGGIHTYEPNIKSYQFSYNTFNKLFTNPSIKFGVKTNICNLNVKKNESGEFVTKNLLDEGGIPELKFMYYDIFDFKTGKYIGMSDESRIQYSKDVQELYKAFTGKKSVPSTIQDFSDIQLIDYKNSNSCKNENGPIYKTYIGTSKEKLFNIFGNKLAKMYSNIQNSYVLLEKVLDELFIYKIVDKINEKGQRYQVKDIVIHPKLTESKLKSIQLLTRNIIVQYYSQCEKDFLEAFEAFEAIIQVKTIQTNTQRIQGLKKSKEAFAIF